MQVTQTNISGVFEIAISPHEDERGLFARTWDPGIAKEHGLPEQFDYSCISTNIAAHTLRGMHFQREPHGEVKLVRCTKGKIFDVALDLRPESPTYKQWHGQELTDENHTALYIPAGCAHGFLSLTENSEALYQISGEFTPDAADGVRFDDPAFAITWPAEPKVIAERDTTYPLHSS